MHIVDQTEDAFKSIDGLGTTLVFREPPTIRHGPNRSRLEHVHGLTYAEATKQFANAHAFKWVPVSVRTVMLDSCNGTNCPDGKCPGDCVCSGYDCWD